MQVVSPCADEALTELSRNAGTQFDPCVVDVFLASFPFATREPARLTDRLGGLAEVLQFN